MDKLETNLLRNRNLTDTLTSVDIEEYSGIVRQLIGTHEEIV